MASVTEMNNGNGQGTASSGAGVSSGSGSTSGEGARSTSGRFTPPPPPPQEPPTAEKPSKAPEYAKRAATWTGHKLQRPRVRVFLLGVALILAAVLFVDGSLGTVFTVAGVIALLVAWLGSRMQGHFAIQWGEQGTKIEFDAGLKPAPEPEPAKPALTQPTAPAAAALAAGEEADVIEGEAHTVEIDVDELRRLIAAADKADEERAA